MNFLNLLRSFNNTQSVKKPNGGGTFTRGNGVPNWDVNYQEFYKPSVKKPFTKAKYDDPPYLNSSYPGQQSIMDRSASVPQINKGVGNNTNTVDNSAVRRAIENNGKFGGLGLLGSDNRSAVEKAINGDNNSSGDFADYMDKISDLESTDYSDAAKKADIYNKIGAGIGLGANLLGVMNALNSKEPDTLNSPYIEKPLLDTSTSASREALYDRISQNSAAAKQMSKEFGNSNLFNHLSVQRMANSGILQGAAMSEQMRNNLMTQKAGMDLNATSLGAQLKSRTDMFNAQMIAQANAQRGQDLTASLAGLANILPGYGEAKFKNELWANSLDDQITNSRLSSYYGLNKN